MSRRDRVINTLLGTFLLVVFFACLAGIALICWLGFIAVEWILRRTFPGLNVTAELFWIVISSLVMVWYVVEETRKRRWRNAFLFFAVAWIMSLILIVAMHPSIGGIRGNWVLYCWLPLIMVLGIAGNVALGRLKFFLAAAVVSAVAAVNTGLLGYGALSRGVENCLLTATIVWLGIDIIRNRFKTVPSNLSVAPPPAGT